MSILSLIINHRNRNLLTTSCLLLLAVLLFRTEGLSQVVSAEEKAAQKKENDTMEQLLDMSRPGPNHDLIAKLAGTWNFQDANLSFVKGTLTRKPMYNGRFFQVEVTGGKLKLPVARGAMIEDNYRSFQIEGYDNPRGKFVTISMNNHIGSDIQTQTGTYDPAKKEFIFEWDEELLPGEKKKTRRILRITDATHYTEEYFDVQNGIAEKVRELNYIRVGGK